ncbi:receptor-like protein kinase ANXUR2 [Abrus precatorius]|uniref:non-specific serine/threonine protein kinase n=1 Tax=Abrus precatorius TaxID=3816 RepID=A0A8B8LTR1_ABRPR|nr:receptor-like protein kinase ANXUR2 [Abrus precatorius]
MGPFPCLSCFTTPKSNTKNHFIPLEQLCHRYSCAQLQKATNNFNQSSIVSGEGPCQVYKGHLKAQGYVAIKKFKTRSPAGDTEFRAEVKILCQLHHPNVVPLIGFGEHKSDKFVVYDYVSNGSLYDCLHGTNINNVVPLSWKQRLNICIGVARGLHYIHFGSKIPIIHRAVKSSNILLDHNLVPKLADFGLCKKEPQGDSRPKPPRVEVREDLEVSLEYMDPEFHMYGWLSKKCDVYSFGVVLLEILCRKEACFLTPYGVYVYLVKWAFNDERKGVPEKIVDPCLMGKIAPECWQVFIEILQRCLASDGEERPTMGEVEVVLENALLLQERADAEKEHHDPSSNYSLANCN